ncbi:hypothetical protein ACFO0N_07840 [Halobium salinum]|uniref:DUF7344 domain-containing protein n=1 Tax=Halobium salinum TaxID=1364940 RepID=A0ABD5PAX9_9EURY|nr:hypothetical protein [Halobium salinum]
MSQTDGGRRPDDDRDDIDGDDVPLDTLYGVLSHSRRRRVLDRLLGGDEVDVDDVADTVVAAEAGKPVEDVTSEERRRVETALRHQHLPRLVDDGFVAWVREGETVRLALPVSTVEPYLHPGGTTTEGEATVGDGRRTDDGTPTEERAGDRGTDGPSGGVLVGAGLLSVLLSGALRALPETTRARLAAATPLLVGVGLVAAGVARLARGLLGDSRRSRF